MWYTTPRTLGERGFNYGRQRIYNPGINYPLGVKLNIPAFLDDKEQLDKEDVLSQTIASVRIHVERIIARIKKFKVLKTEIPLNMNGTINQI